MRLLIAVNEFVLVLMAASVEVVIEEVWSVLLYIFVANAFCVKEDIVINELVLVLMAASVDVVIDDVCKVLLKIVGAYKS